jgi:hypothetical protein
MATLRIAANFSNTAVMRFIPPYRISFPVIGKGFIFHFRSRVRALKSVPK